MLQDPFFLPLPVTVFSVRPFVVLLLAFAESDREFRTALVPVQVQGDQGIALAFDGPCQPVQLMAMHEQLASPSRISLDMCGCRL